ncbi:hypothetical protein [Cytobacillus gottheilii]|uniref:Uncharacterized protein n=1 Tax=Cytobacillus gottheilii TaxID=859144 RepID=A0ABX8FG65_9BACI|nr:hypothetical protein [Cytobacillus gottheilii]QVY62999.1 hypothetical protein J1899_08145 [Cytobacillus gottheilii]
MQIGRKVYYDKSTGNLIIDTGDRSGAVSATTFEQDVETYTSLSERNLETVDVIQLPFGAYAQDFREGRLIGVNLETKEPIFEYHNPESPDNPIVPAKPLSVQIEDLRLESAQSNAELFEMMIMISGGGA